MNSLLVLCLTLAVTMASHHLLSDVLKSPAKTLALYGDYKAKEHIHYSANEDRMRFGIFKLNAALVAHLNEDDNEEAQFGLNLFSSMTEVEKKSYLGLNVTGHLAHTDVEEPLLEFVAAPDSKLWTNEGTVTAVKNQGGCGSCWTFGAVGGLETRYKQLSGRLRNFAEQEYLDCVYDGRDGCQGGWPDDCYDYSKSLGGRLAAAADYPYRASDGSCQSSSKPDAAIAYNIDGYVSVSASESANIAALADGSLSMAFEVTNKFQQYQSGIIRDNTCTGRPNHAVTGVGYTPNYVLVKNSWGSGWGDNGFVKFARNHGNCQLFEFSSYPRLTSTGTSDDGADDKATDYHATDDDVVPTPDPTCEDQVGPDVCVLSYCQWEDIGRTYCQKTCGYCPEPTPEPCEDQEDPAVCAIIASDYCQNTCGVCPSEPCEDQQEAAVCEILAQDYCQKTCGVCPDDDDDDEDCAPGTIRCPDGVCRHEHMC